MDTYNKLMHLMNDKVLRNVNSVLTGSRGKSTEKGMSIVTSVTQTTSKTLNNPAIINQTSSSKKLKTFATNANIQNSAGNIQMTQNHSGYGVG